MNEYKQVYTLKTELTIQKEQLQKERQQINKTIGIKAKKLIEEDLIITQKEREKLQKKQLEITQKMEEITQLRIEVDQIGGVELAKEAISEISILRNTIETIKKEKNEIENSYEKEKINGEEMRIKMDKALHDLWVAEAQLQLKETEEQARLDEKLFKPKSKMRNQLTNFLCELENI